MPLNRGAEIAGFVVERQLGAGGMGAVYLARHPRLPRHVALKVLGEEFGQDPEFRSRFEREAELAARLAHPNVVAIHDRGVADGHLWIAMQYVDGTDAAHLIRQGPAVLPTARAVGIVEQAAQGLDEAHRVGLLHRDVKPANILIAARPDGGDRVLVTDFGIARAAGDASTHTAAGAVLATLAYAAPEQILGGPMDQRVDVYGLGCTLFHLVTGSVPFPRDSPAAVMRAHLSEPPPKPSAIDRRLAPFDAVIARAMAKNPADRYPSCAALAADAGAALRGERVGARPRRWLLAGAAAVVVLLALVAGWFALRPQEPQPAAAPKAPSTSVPPPVTAKPWGDYQFMADAFPKLLPRTPTGQGHQGLRCTPVDDKLSVVSLQAPPHSNLRLLCPGDNEPLEGLIVFCDPARVPLAVRVDPGMSHDGEERWSRPSGGGHVSWGRQFDEPLNTLVVYFDDSERSFCRLSASTSGPIEKLRKEWWDSAPV